jgi:sec-independent protein translocase protein TatA
VGAGALRLILFLLLILLLIPLLFCYNTTMFGLSLGHLLIVLVIVLLFGARKIPELGSGLGKGLHAFKKGLEGKDDDNNNPKLPPQA